MSVAAPPAPPPPVAGDAPIPEAAPPARARRPWGQPVADVLGVAALGAIALSGFAPAYGGVRHLAVGGAGLGLGIALAALAAWRRVPLLLLAGAVLVVDVVVGRWLVGTDGAVELVAPSWGSARLMTEGALRGWVNLLTTIPPVGAAQNLLVVPWTTGLAVGALATTLARRAERWWLLALLPLAAAFVAAVLTGDDEPAWGLQATAFVVVALLWGSYRQRRLRTGEIAGRQRRPWASGALVLGGTAAVGLLLGRTSFVGGDAERMVLRDRVEPPVDLNEVASPLEGFRSYRAEDRRDEVLFTVSGLEPGDRLRLATLDHYDGVVWHVRGDDTAPGSSGLFQRVGEEIPVGTTGDHRTVTVEVGEGGGPWVPTLGATREVSFSGPRATTLAEGFRYNLSTHTAVEPDGLRPGDRYRLEAVVPDPRTDLVEGEPDPTVAAPSPATVDAVTDLVNDLLAQDALGSSPLAGARAVEARFAGRADVEPRGYFSDGGCPPPESREPGDVPPPSCVEGHEPSRPGHSAERMRTLLDPERGYFLGNEEQYASAMALVADQLGLPARVVMGFAPEVTGGRTEVRGGDVTAWTEVAVAGVGWIPLDPTPTDTDPPAEETTQRPPPDQLFPPPPASLPESAPPSSGGRGDAPDEEPGDPEGILGGLPAWVRTAGAVALPPLLLVGGLTAAMAAAKGMRRRRRRHRGSPATRIAAGWEEVSDLARDLGDVVPATATRRESAVLLARPGVPDLARRADALAFGPRPVDPATADAYWLEVDTTRRAMLGEVSRWARWKALVSPSSLRRRPAAAPGPRAAAPVGAGVRPRPAARW